jgi:antitoxin component YwqK of YwqJK toxin-antitoxin module
MKPLDLQTAPNPRRAKPLFWCLPAIAAGALFVFFKQTPQPSPDPAPDAAVVEVPRSQLELRSARLYQISAANPFNGLMVEHYPDGALRSRSAVTNGLLHGPSQGWHTNGQLQVTEHFKEGVSHGLRTKWHPNGVKHSEASIVDGKLQGGFRKWHDNGTLAEQVEFAAGQPDGLALAYFESGFTKTRVRLKDGKVIEQQSWNDSEHKATGAE